MSKAVWVLTVALVMACPAFAGPPAKPPPASPPQPKGKVAMSPILNASTRDIMMPGKGMPKKAAASSKNPSHSGPR